MAAPSSDWLRHFLLLLWYHWTEFDDTRQKVFTKISTSSTKFVFWSRSENQAGHPGLWLTETFSTSPLNIIWRNVSGSKISKSLPSLCFSGRSEKKDGCPGLWLADTFSNSPLKLLIGNQRNFTWSKIPLSSTKFFRADRKDKMVALISDWLPHFRLLLWNRWKEFNETWQEARSQRPLRTLCFTGWSERQDGRPWHWFNATFSTSPLKPLKKFNEAW